MKIVLRWVGLLTLLVGFWMYLLKQSWDDKTKVHVQRLPFYALLTFAVLEVIWLAWGVSTFRTVPEEYTSLQKDIARAKAALSKAGVIKKDL